MNDLKKTGKYGYVAIIGTPNVGKSTLLNSLLNKKISITSSNSQTTRGCVSSILSGENFAIRLVDTPGYIDKSKHLLDNRLNKSALGWMDSVDLVLLVIDSRQWTEQDEALLAQINFDLPILLIMNKVDLIKNKELLLPKIKELAAKIPCKEVIPVSAQKEINIDKLR
ncbi:MAG: GTPase Era, partial [Legionellales bacterium]|nr:GTPase Era [Legionellales bacterium]